MDRSFRHACVHVTDAYSPGAGLGAGDTPVSNTDQTPCPGGACVLAREDRQGSLGDRHFRAKWAQDTKTHRTQTLEGAGKGAR